MSTKPLQVVAGILIDNHHRVLIAERPQGKTYAGYWEFPGGKIEVNEDARTALVREFQEELGIDTSNEDWQLFYQGGRDNEVMLTFFIAQTQYHYAPQGLENQRWQWKPIAQLHHYPFPEPNTAVLEKLQYERNY